VTVTVSSEDQDGLLGFCLQLHDGTVWSVQTVYSVWTFCIIACVHSSSNNSLIPQRNVQQAVPFCRFIISYGTEGFDFSEYSYIWLLCYDTVYSGRAVPLSGNK
jgi:hypothetical protein